MFWVGQLVHEVVVDRRHENFRRMNDHAVHSAASPPRMVLGRRPTSILRTQSTHARAPYCHAGNRGWNERGMKAPCISDKSATGSSSPVRHSLLRGPSWLTANAPPATAWASTWN